MIDAKSLRKFCEKIYQKVLSKKGEKAANDFHEINLIFDSLKRLNSVLNEMPAPGNINLSDFLKFVCKPNKSLFKKTVE